MTSTSSFPFRRTFFGIALAIGLLGSVQAIAQTDPAAEKPNKPLNLDDKNISEDIAKEIPVAPKTEALSVTPNKLDEGFTKAEKHGIIPTTREITVTGAPQRVTKVTGKDGSYCVYAPTVARTDGIDEIQNGLQNQVRNCPD